MKVLIVTYRREDLLRRCIAQLSIYFDACDVLVVDNNSEESTAISAYCAARGITLISNEKNDGFARAVNIGMRELLGTADETWVLLLNPDADVLLDPTMLARFATADTACITTFDAAAAMPWDCEKPIPNPWRAAWEDSGFGRIRVPQPFGSRYRSFSSRHTGFLAGCFLLMSTAAWKRVGEFDERFWLYSEETDWCLRARKSGMDCIVVPVLGYRHQAQGGGSVEGSPVAAQHALSAYRESRTIFIRKHWGRPGLQAYHLLCFALLGARRLVWAARKLRCREL